MLATHASFCANPTHGPDECCEANPTAIPGIGAVYILAADGEPLVYVQDESRGLIAEKGRYRLDDAETVALAMLAAVRTARGGG